MRNTKRTLSLAALFVIAAAVPAALYAQEPHSGSMMRGGMMGRGHMMGGGHMMERMSRMMEQCNAMMQGDSRGTRPNDQWRKDVPPEPKE